jgi:trans-aconitate methyltransferase
MDLSDPHTLDLFLSVYGTLPRAGPGNTESTLRALELVSSSNPQSVLDLGCGPGAQTLVLADALPKATILALDLLPQMVDAARKNVTRAGFGDRVRVEVGDMAEPPVAAGSQDLIWSEGAIYNLGIERALRDWRPLLTQNGHVAFTEPIWLKPSRPDELSKWWQEEYPAITDEAGVRELISKAGYETVGFFPLPAEAWDLDYYTPMRARIAELRKSHPNDDIADAISQVAECEIDMHDRYADYYSYGFFIVKPH